ncbi:MAG TPA: metal ABC transporter ATP-binding protein [Gammaproteobacteria bacterium]
MSNSSFPREILISAHNLTLAYGSHVVFEDLSFHIEKGGLIGLVGPNGGGKTTLLRAILGALKPRAGEIVLRDPDIRFGYVPQRRHLDPIWPLRVIDVVVMGTYASVSVGGRIGPEQTAVATDALEAVGIAHLAERRYAELSGGQQQRTLVARALATGPNFLVLDEPTQGMDLASSTGILELISRLHDRGITILIASHRLNTIANYVETIALVHDGCIQIGPRDELMTGENLSTLYGLPVEILHSDGDRIVIFGG